MVIPCTTISTIPKRVFENTETLINTGFPATKYIKKNYHFHVITISITMHF